MNVKELMSQKPTAKVVDKYSGAEFTIADLIPILVNMVELQQQKDADDFADRMELVGSK